MSMAMSLRRGVGGVRRLGLVAARLLIVAIIGWGAGFVYFLRMIAQPGEVPVHADGIVALTGGAERVETALRLLANGRADRLLLSGIGPATELATLARRASVDPTPLADRTVLGRSAASTRGNAQETAAWVDDTGIGSLIVVTAYYHLPRALTEFRRAMPEVRMYPMPVGGGPAHRAALGLLAGEYSKYLVTLSGLTAWLPPREALHGAAVD